MKKLLFVLFCCLYSTAYSQNKQVDSLELATHLWGCIGIPLKDTQILKKSRILIRKIAWTTKEQFVRLDSSIKANEIWEIQFNKDYDDPADRTMQIYNLDLTRGAGKSFRHLYKDQLTWKFDKSSQTLEITSVLGKIWKYKVTRQSDKELILSKE